MSKNWQVWSIDDAKARALVVDEGTYAHCRDSATRRNKAAVKHDANIRFEALPAEQAPEFQDTPTARNLP